jgi:molecular chaperone IbpA
VGFIAGGLQKGLERQKANAHLIVVDANRVHRPAFARSHDVMAQGEAASNLNHSRSQEDFMRHVDFSPLYRSTVGFDRLFTMLDSLAQPDQGQTYPPYNIERTGDNAYRVTMAVAGFDETELSIEAREHTLTVKGEKADETDNGQSGDARSDFLYRGIAARAFERRFQLADHVEVRGASLKNGLLHIDLVREIPEAMKPRRIAITAAHGQAKQIEASQA